MRVDASVLEITVSLVVRACLISCAIALVCKWQMMKIRFLAFDAFVLLASDVYFPVDGLFLDRV